VDATGGARAEAMDWGPDEPTKRFIDTLVHRVVYLVYGWRSIEHALYSCCYAFYFYQKIDPEEKLRLLVKANLILGGKTE